MLLSCPNCGYCIIDLADVKLGKSETPALPRAERPKHQVSRLDEACVNTVEANSAQYAGGDVLTTADKVQVQELVKQGYSFARVRQMIGKRVTLTQIMSAAKRPK